MKEEPLCDLNENSKVKVEEFGDFIENYIDDPDFDEDKPIKLPKKRKKSSESDQVIQTKTRLSQYQKSKLVTPDVNPKVVCPQLVRCMEATVSAIFSKLKINSNFWKNISVSKLVCMYIEVRNNFSS